MIQMRGIKYLSITMVAVILFITSSGCGERMGGEPENAETETDYSYENNRIFGEVGDTSAALTGKITIDGLGTFTFDPREVTTIREDIFRDGYFSIFDVLVHLEQKELIEIDYYFDEDMNTYVINNLDGYSSWWYDAFYDGGWPERSVFRMDHYPYKDKMVLNLVRTTNDYINSVYNTYRDEVRRRNENGGKIIVTEVIIELKNENLVFENVEVKAHNLRSDMFQPGVITAIDTILSLAEEEKISYDLQWYESIGTAGIVKSYWVNRINDNISEGRCGFVYEAGDEEFYFFRGNHNHIPSDVRVINSPQYVKYFWICI
jgi:hypothetical protein